MKDTNNNNKDWKRNTHPLAVSKGFLLLLLFGKGVSEILQICLYIYIYILQNGKT